jgi:hypothetical protein
MSRFFLGELRAGREDGQAVEQRRRAVPEPMGGPSKLVHLDCGASVLRAVKDDEGSRSDVVR